VEIGIQFRAPGNVTFGCKGNREGLYIWYDSGKESNTSYIVVGTDYKIPFDSWMIIGTAIEEAGLVWHLVRELK